MTELVTLYDWRVEPKEIDHLGHMNVNVYRLKTEIFAARLMAALGLDEARLAREGAVLRFPDLLSLYRREQFLGAPLAVRGNVLTVEREGIRLYTEIVNTEKDEVASIGQTLVSLADAKTEHPRPLPDDALLKAVPRLTIAPPHGRPRNLNLAPWRSGQSLGHIGHEELRLGDPYTVTAAQCDARGFFVLRSQFDLFFGGFSDEMKLSKAPGNEFLGRLAWPTVECRWILAHRPRLGARLQAFYADLALTGRARRWCYWCFDVESRALVSTAEFMGVAFDLKARKVIDVPDDIRAALTARARPDLAPT